MAEYDNDDVRRSGASAAQSAMQEIEERERIKILWRKRRFRFLVTTISLAIIVAAVILTSTIIGSNLDLSRNMLRSPEIRVAGYDGSTLKLVKGHYSQDVSLNTIPKNVQNVFIAAADPDFYSNWGIHAGDFARVLTGSPEPGQSITMKVARSFFKTPAFGRGRNLQELLVAMWLEMKFSKKAILRSYLERSYVGGGVFGITAASRLWFGAPAERISLHQAAVLAASMRDPAHLNPLHFPAASAAAANEILQKMVALKMLEVTRMSALTRLEPQLDPQIHQGRISQYLIDLVMDKLAARVGYTGRDLDVITSIDPGIQMVAQEVVSEVSHLRLKPRGADQAALLAISADGRVRAMIGGTSYDPMSRNRAWDVRHYPGRMIKVLPYYYALNQNADPTQWVRDTKMAAGGWRPINPDRRYMGQISMREAFVRNVNTVPANLADQFGLNKIRDYAHDVGIESPLSNDIRTVVGLDPVTLPDIARLQDLPLNAGLRPTVSLIDQVIVHGGKEVVYQRQELEREKLLSDDAMSAVNSLMASSTDPQLRLDRPFAAFGAEADRGSDIWYAGYTSDLYTVVWVGNDDHSPAPAIRANGEVADLWRLFMLDAHQGMPIRSMVRALHERRVRQDNSVDTWKHGLNDTRAVK